MKQAAMNLITCAFPYRASSALEEQGLASSWERNECSFGHGLAKRDIECLLLIKSQVALLHWPVINRLDPSAINLAHVLHHAGTTRVTILWTDTAT